MAGRVITNALPRRVLIPSILVALFALGIAGGVMGVGNPVSGRVGAAWSSSGAGVETTTGGSAAGAGLVSLEGLQFPQDVETGGMVLGEYEGTFSAETGRLTVQPRETGSGGRSRAGMPAGVSGRYNPGAELARGSAYTVSVASSALVTGGSNVPMVSGDVVLNNLSTSTLYNTRLVFTSFKVGTSSGADAANVPGASGLAFYNDGLIALGGKLNVSRNYGDIAPGASSRAVWNFAVASQPTSFFFTYRVVADVGVAAESVQPAAVQVSGSAGTTVVINGRGMSTPTVQLLNAAGSVVSALTVGSSTATQATVTIPAGTAPGVYSVRVTNQGGTVGGAGSSTIVGRLTVTSAPDGAHTLTGAISGFGDTGPYLINGDATINVAAPILPGTVIYVKSGATITVGSAGNLTANGGVPGVPGGAAVANASQIVITAQRAAGEALPANGAWGGIVATSTATSTMTMRNVVVEYAGSTTGAAITLTGSGRTLRMTDSIVRNSAGSAVAAAGTNDSLIGFSRNRIENNGTSANNPAVVVSGNAALGLFDIPGSDVPAATSVGDASYYYSSANEISGNQVNVVQIGVDGSATSNDFTKSGVLVGQDTAPLRIEGSNNNPAIIGVVESLSTAMPSIDSTVQTTTAEVGINPAARIQLGQGMDLQVGDYPTNRRGGLAANGYAGAYVGSTQGSAGDRFIEFDKVAGKGNFGSIYFTRLAKPSSIMNRVRVQSGGNGARGSNPVVVEAITLSLTNSAVEGGVLDTLGARVNTGGSTFTNVTTVPSIDTIAGGIFGDRNLGIQAILSNPTSVARDPLNRGIFIADTPSGASFIRFLNTTRETVVIGGISIPAGVLKNIAGGGINLGENVPGTQADVGTVSGLAVSPNGSILYFIDIVGPQIRAVNISSTPQTIAGASIGVGNVQTYAAGSGFGSVLFSLATHPTTGDIYVVDSTPGVNKVLKVPANAASSNVTPETVVGNGSTTTKDEDPFIAGPATSIPLFGPRSIAFKGNDLIISDTGHGRVIQVDSSGNTTLVAQFPVKAGTSDVYPGNPYTAGIAIFGGKIYLANGNAQDLIQVDTVGTAATFTTIAGAILTPCEYTPGNTCGDGGPANQALFTLVSRTAAIPQLVGLASDSKGLYIADQGPNRGRIRYINLSSSKAEVAGVTIDAGNIDTVAGAGFSTPYDGALATSAALSQPVGAAIDPEGNLWISDTLAGKIRFVNMGTTAKTLFKGTSSEIEVPPGVIISVNREQGTKPDPAPIIGAVFDNPQGLFATADGLFVADSKKGPPTTGSPGRRTGLVRFINTSGKTVTFYSGGSGKIDVLPGDIATIAGGSTNASSTGDNGLATAAKLIGPSDVIVHPTTGNIYIADPGQNRVRMINRSTGVITSLVLPSATTATASDEYTGVAIDSTGRLLVANAGTNRRILREKTPGSGNAANGFDIILSAGLLTRPRDVVEGADGALYVTNAGDPTSSATVDNKIIRITLSGATGTGAVYLGTTAGGYVGDGGPITNARIDITPQPIDVKTVGSAVPVRTTVNIIRGPGGELIFTDTNNNAIRRIR